MKKLLFFIPFLIFSCTEDDSNLNKENNLPNLIHQRYLYENNNGLSFSMANEDYELKISYKNSLPNKIEGGGILFNTIFNNLVGFNSKLTEFTDSENGIVRKSKNTKIGFYYPTQTRFILNGNRIEYSVTESVDNKLEERRTYKKYTYNNNQLIKELTYWADAKNQNYHNVGIERLFYFNSNRNLDSIVRQNVVVENNLDTKYDTIQFKDRTVVYLGGYDKSPNPFKQLFMVDEFFDRSLSENNYTEVTEKSVSGKKILLHSKFYIQYNYDNNYKLDLTY